MYKPYALTDLPKDEKPPRSFTATMTAQEARQAFEWYANPAMQQYRRS